MAKKNITNEEKVTNALSYLDNMTNVNKNVFMIDGVQVSAKISSIEYTEGKLRLYKLDPQKGSAKLHSLYCLLKGVDDRAFAVECYHFWYMLVSADVAKIEEDVVKVLAEEELSSEHVVRLDELENRIDYIKSCCASTSPVDTPVKGVRNIVKQYYGCRMEEYGEEVKTSAKSVIEELKNLYNLSNGGTTEEEKMTINVKKLRSLLVDLKKAILPCDDKIVKNVSYRCNDLQTRNIYAFYYEGVKRNKETGKTEYRFKKDKNVVEELLLQTTHQMEVSTPDPATEKEEKK